MNSNILDNKYSHMLYICKNHSQKHGITKLLQNHGIFRALPLTVTWILLSEI